MVDYSQNINNMIPVYNLQNPQNPMENYPSNQFMNNHDSYQGKKQGFDNINSNKFQQLGTKLNTIQNMFFNANGSQNPQNITNNTLFPNNSINNEFNTLNQPQQPNGIHINQNNPILDIGYLNNVNGNQTNQNQFNSNGNFQNYEQINQQSNFLNETMSNVPNMNNINNLNQNFVNGMGMGSINQIEGSPIKNFLSSTSKASRGKQLSEVLDEKFKKKSLLGDIQQQIINNKNAKLNELEKKRMEDQKYLNDINNYNPFGRNGAGAPLRDNSGNIITRRKALISDNKKLNDSFGKNTEDNKNLNNIINDLTQRISSYGKNINVNNTYTGQRYNSAKLLPQNQNLNVHHQIINQPVPMNLNTMYNQMCQNQNMLNDQIQNNYMNNINPNQNMNYHINPNQMAMENLNMNLPGQLGNPFQQNGNNYNQMIPNNYNNSNFPQNYTNFQMYDNMGNQMQNMADNNFNQMNNQGNFISSNLPIQNSVLNPQNSNTNLNFPINGNGGLFENIGADEKKKKPNDEYKKSLLEQIEMKKIEKENDKKKKRETELEEDKRIQKELEIIKQRYDEETTGKKKKIEEEQSKNIKRLEEYLKENEKEKKNIPLGKKKHVIDFDPNQNVNKSFGEETKVISQTEFSNNNISNIPRNNYSNNLHQDQNFNHGYNQIPSHFFNPLAPEFSYNNQYNPYQNNPHQFNPNNPNQFHANNQNYPNNIINSADFQQSPAKENLEKKIADEIQLLKNTFIENQNNLLQRINELKSESLTANTQNSETIKELSKLKHELENIRKDEEYRRKYVYDVLLEKSLKYNDIVKSTKLPGEDFDFKFLEENERKEADTNSLDLDLADKNNNINRLIANRNLNKLNKTNLSSFSGFTNFQMNATSKFIDMKTKEIYKNLDDHPNNKLKNVGNTILEEIEENHRGIRVENDLASLQSYYNNIEKKNDNLFFELEDKNLEEIKNLNINLTSQIENSRRKQNKSRENIMQNSNIEKEVQLDHIKFKDQRKNQINFDDNISSISELKNNNKFDYQANNYELNSTNNSGYRSNKNVKNPYTNHNAGVSNLRIEENEEYDKNSDFSVNRVIEKNNSRLKVIDKFHNEI